MTKFICSILVPVEGRKNVVLEAVDLNALKSELKNKKIVLLAHREYHSKNPIFNAFYSRKNRVSNMDIANFTYELEVMLRSGLSISSALVILKDGVTNKKILQIVSASIHSIEIGESFSVALSHFPEVFNSFYINMVFIGEESGNLSPVLSKLSSNLKEGFYLRKKIIALLLYPCITFFFALILGGILLIFVLPEFIKIFQENGVKLPFLTIILIFFYRVLVDYFYYLVFFFTLTLFFLKKFIRSKKGILLKYKFLTFFPLIRNIYRRYLSIQTLDNFYLLLSSGVSLFNAFKLIYPLTDNPFLKSELENALTRLEKGETLNKAFDNSIFFDKTTLLMISIGENSGALSEMFKTSYEFTLNKFNFILKELVILLEPIIILFLGVFVGSIVLGIYLPMFNLISII